MRKKRFVLLFIASFLAVMNVYAGAPKGSFELGTAAAVTDFPMVYFGEGTNCDQIGDIGTTREGLILSCQSGNKWKGVGGGGLDGKWKWYDSNNRREIVTYTNNTGKTIFAAVTDETDGDRYGSIYAYIDGQLIADQNSGNDRDDAATVIIPIPNGASYRFLLGNSDGGWWEFRDE